MKRIFLLMIKYMPIIQMVGMLANNTLYCVDIAYSLPPILDFLIGNSLSMAILLFVSSKLFGFCKYYRVIIISNLINILISYIDKIYNLSISDINLLAIYYIVVAISFIIIITIHVKYIHNDRR